MLCMGQAVPAQLWGRGYFSPVSSLFFFLCYEEPKLLPADHMLGRPSVPGMLAEARQRDVSSLPAPAMSFKTTARQLNLAHTTVLPPKISAALRKKEEIHLGWVRAASRTGSQQKGEAEFLFLAPLPRCFIPALFLSSPP